MFMSLTSQLLKLSCKMSYINAVIVTCLGLNSWYWLFDKVRVMTDCPSALAHAI